MHHFDAETRGNREVERERDLATVGEGCRMAVATR